MEAAGIEPASEDLHLWVPRASSVIGFNKKPPHRHDGVLRVLSLIGPKKAKSFPKEGLPAYMTPGFLPAGEQGRTSRSIKPRERNRMIRQLKKVRRFYALTERGTHPSDSTIPVEPKSPPH